MHSHYSSFLVATNANDKEALKLIKTHENPPSVTAALTRSEPGEPQKKPSWAVSIALLVGLYAMLASSVGYLKALLDIAILCAAAFALGWLARQIDKQMFKQRNQHINQMIMQGRIIRVRHMQLDNWRKCFEHIGIDLNKEDAMAEFVKMCQQRQEHLGVVRSLDIEYADDNSGAVKALSEVLRERIRLGLYRTNYAA